MIDSEELDNVSSNTTPRDPGPEQNLPFSIVIVRPTRNDRLSRAEKVPEVDMWRGERSNNSHKQRSLLPPSHSLGRHRAQRTSSSPYPAFFLVCRQRLRHLYSDEPAPFVSLITLLVLFARLTFHNAFRIPDLPFPSRLSCPRTRRYYCRP